ncbi:MAG TPA: Tm-1-like ATP-binding domain-containing protein [Syntrophobacteraceae bacterium]|nr:Tm-1-like ATP-binding domain-containing protein [Syntrophobacteraceae bacterium]
MAKPKIIVAGILDTKGEEVRFLVDRIRKAGGEAKVLELSVGKEVGWADIGLGELLKRSQTSHSKLFSLERSKASELIVRGAVQWVSESLQRGEIDGFVALGGGLGTSMATRIMRTLPIGMPKLMITSMASGDVSSYVGTRDITMLYPIAEAGLNAITRKILNYAAAGIVGMAGADPMPPGREKPLVGCTMMGTTTPCVLRASKLIEDQAHCEMMINHAVGSGGRSMEELISEGQIIGMLDVTTHEITDFLFGGILNAGPNRLTAAGQKGIPQVVSTGELELIVFGPRDTIPNRLVEEEAAGVPGRRIHVHHPAISTAGITLEEAFLIGRHISGKIFAAKGPTLLCIPLRGWGSYEIAGPNLSLGWAGPGPGPLWIGDPEKPQWSFRVRGFIDGLLKDVDDYEPNIQIVLADMHINEPAFADLLAESLCEMLSGNWRGIKHFNDERIFPLGSKSFPYR